MGIGQLHGKSGGVFEKEEKWIKWDREIWEMIFLGKKSSWSFPRSVRKMGTNNPRQK